MTTYETGLFSEWLARMYLRLHGFRILHSRYITGRNTGRAEIDIIARRRNLMVFIEVKHRKNLAAGYDAITNSQATRLRRGAETYIARTRWTGDARFDVIVICGIRIYWAKNAL